MYLIAIIGTMLGIVLGFILGQISRKCGEIHDTASNYCPYCGCLMDNPCVAHQICHEDKIKVLDKIRAEIENDWQLKKYPSSPFSCGLKRAIEIIDKYKAEWRDKE